MASTVQRIWDSPTMMTWAALGTNAMKFFLVLPLVLRLFPAEEVAVWYLMATLLQVQFMMDLGFSVTGARFFAYAMGGASDLGRPHEGTGKPNHPLLGQVFASLRSVFLLLGLGAALVLGIIGTLLLMRPVGATSVPMEAWIAWGIMLLGTTIGFCGLVYSTYLQGTNRVALTRRWDAVTNLGSIATVVAVLSWRADLVAFALAMQGWTVVALVRNRALAKQTESAAFEGIVGWRPHAATLRAIWASAWRSGLGVLLNAGVVRLSAGLLAFFVSPMALAAYLVVFNLLDRLNQFASAPFYSQLPSFGRLYSEGNWKELLGRARHRMWWSVGLFAVGSLALAVFGEWALGSIGSDTPFVGALFTAALASGLVLHRLGAMHLQLYTLSNHVIWHIIDGVAGAIFAVAWMVAVPQMGLWGIPVAIIAGYGGFYLPYAFWASHRFSTQLLGRDAGGIGVAHGR